MTEIRDADYDIIIIGGGPAGLSAGLYAARDRRRTLLIERELAGGQIALTAEVENYPGIPTINGLDLAEAMKGHAEKYGLETRLADVTGIEQRPDGRHVVCTSEGEHVASAVIVTSGATHNHLGVLGEDRLTGYGVSYCATCDGPFFAGDTIAVVGGGDAALDEALFLTRFASKIYVIHRRDKLRAGAILQERAFAHDKIEFVWNTVVEEIAGDKNVSSVKLRNAVTGESSDLAVTGVFVFVGMTPSTAFLHEQVRMDNSGHIFVNEWMETDIAGLYAAGDARAMSARQVVTAAGDGATAAIAADRYISEHFPAAARVGAFSGA